MNRTYVTDITHFLNDKGVIPTDMNEEAKQFAKNLTNLVTLVTQCYPKPPDERITCWGELHQNPCTGSLKTALDFKSSEIFWYCTQCGDRGFIRNWENSFFDCMGK